MEWLMEEPNKANTLFDRFAYAVADRIADRVAEQIAAQIPLVVETVTKTVLAETTSTVRDMPSSVSEWVRKLAGGR